MAACPVLAAKPPTAHNTRVQAVNDTAHLHLVGEEANSLIEEGQATGTLPGRVRARLTIRSSAVRSGFTIYLHGGSISGHSTGNLHLGKGRYASFAGTLTVSHGTGRYTRATGTGHLYGVINRTNDSSTVQTIGQLHI